MRIVTPLRVWLMLTGCIHVPGGIAPSTLPLEQDGYTVVAESVEGSDPRPHSRVGRQSHGKRDPRAQAFPYRGARLDVVWPQVCSLFALGTAGFFGSLARLRRSVSLA